ncbi:MAG: hypothetical protein ACLT0W_03335 [Clostridium sp.]
MRTVEFKMERPGLVSAGDKVKIIEREGTSSYTTLLILCSYVRLLRRQRPH